MQTVLMLTSQPLPAVSSGLCAGSKKGASLTESAFNFFNKLVGRDRLELSTKGL
jgi:hypothetical protein